MNDKTNTDKPERSDREEVGCKSFLAACALRALELYKEDRNCEHGGSARSKLEREFGVAVVREMLSKGIENNF